MCDHCTCNLLHVLPQVFVAVEETAEASLRILDSDKPNLKDAAFAFKRIGEELDEPLIGRLAQIPDYGEIDLCLDLKSEHLGSLISYLKAMLKKREADWLSAPVLAAACVNPVYMYAPEGKDRWPFAKSSACEQAVAEVIDKLLWGDSKLQSDALEGLDRYLHGEGVYSAEGALELLQMKTHDPLSFWRHVGRSRLSCDQESILYILTLVTILTVRTILTLLFMLIVLTTSRSLQRRLRFRLFVPSQTNRRPSG